MPVVLHSNVDDLISSADPDVLVIDVDGQDYWLWEATTSVGPFVVVIEFNARLGDVVEPKGTPYQGPLPDWGAGLEPLCRLGESKGYRLVHTDASAVNAFFVRSDAPFVGITDRTLAR